MSWKDILSSSLHQLLAPSTQTCLTCGKMIRSGGCGVNGFTEICAACYVSIPWITVPRCPVCGRAVGCPDCSRAGQAERYFQINRSAVQYNAAMREWLAQYKFRGRESLGPLFAQMMKLAMRGMLKELSDRSGVSRGFFDGITFVPVSEARMLERGFNQSRTLAYGVANVAKAPVLELLERSRHTEKQSFKNRKQRLLELKGVFKPVPDAAGKLEKVFLAQPYLLSPVRLLLVDDVYTTGSTVDTCALALHGICGKLGRSAEIYSVTWARS